MPFDGIVIKNLIKEWNLSLIDGKVDKVYQPERDEIVLGIRANRATQRLVLSASSNFAKMHITDQIKENPIVAPAFCMLLRKHLTGAKIIAFNQPLMDRVIEISFECFDDLGYNNHKKLIIEVMGRNSNIIFIDGENNKIIDSIKRIDEDISRLREILPGITYELPPSFDKHDPLTINVKDFINLAHSDIAPINSKKFIYQYLYGISPMAAGNMCSLAHINPSQPINELDETTLTILHKSITDYINDTILNPQILLVDGIYKDFYCYDIPTDDNSSSLMYDSMNITIDNFYLKRDLADRIKQRTTTLRKLIGVKLDRSYKKLDIQEKEINASDDAIIFKVYGDLITSFAYNITSGDSSVILNNFYEEDNREITIKLDPDITPIENAQIYYKKYAKSKNAKEALTIQIKNNKEEIEYLEGQLVNLENSTSELDIMEIRDELVAGGYMKKQTGHKAKQPKKAAPLTFTSSTGYIILVGKNNIQNDQLTFKTATFNDIWLHAKDMPGSHVIIKSGGAQVDDETLAYAASLAAYYSKGKASSKVPVDYTVRKHVKKPNGAKPGMVIYTNQTTIYANPISE